MNDAHHRRSSIRIPARCCLSVLVFLLVGAPVSPGAANAQTHLGPQANVASVLGVGVGARLTTELGPMLEAESDFLSRLQGHLMLDYFFIGDSQVSGTGGSVTVDQSYYEFGALVTYPFDVEANVEPYVGAGLAFGHLSTDVEVRQGTGSATGSASDSEIGLSLVGGVRFPDMSVPLFLELRFSSIRFIEAGGDQSNGLYLTAGLAFPL